MLPHSDTYANVMVTECSIKGEFHYCPTLLVMCWGACVPVVRAKVLDRDGHDDMQCPKGWQYIADMANTDVSMCIQLTILVEQSCVIIFDRATFQCWTVLAGTQRLGTVSNMLARDIDSLIPRPLPPEECTLRGGCQFVSLGTGSNLANLVCKARKLVETLYRQFCSWADTNNLLTIYCTCIQPHLEYACQLWDPFINKGLQSLRDQTEICLWSLS